MTLIILDRDGVINYDSDAFIKSPDEWIPIPGSLEAIAQLTRAGFTLAVVSNQSGVGRGYFTLETLAAIHEKMMKAIENHGGHITEIAFCPHMPDAGCDCRKPKPGMLYEIAEKLKMDLSESWLIGDAWRDIEAGLAVKAKTILVLTGKGEKTFAHHKDDLKNTLIYHDLASAAKYLDSLHPTHVVQ